MPLDPIDIINVARLEVAAGCYSTDLTVRLACNVIYHILYNTRRYLEAPEVHAEYTIHITETICRLLPNE